MVDENYDDDEHLEEIRKKIFERYDAVLRRLAEEEKNDEQQNKV